MYPQLLKWYLKLVAKHFQVPSLVYKRILI